MRDGLECVAFLAVVAVFFPLNQWLVNRKELDPRPYLPRASGGRWERS